MSHGHGGRPSHNFWEKGSYERRKENEKIVAYCLICKKILRNTAKNRLQTHRNVCRNETDLSSALQSSESTGKSSLTDDSDDNENVVKTIDLENIQSASIVVDAVTSSDQGISKYAKVIAVGVEDAPEVSILPDFDMPTVSHQEFNHAVTTTLPHPKRLKTRQEKRKLNSFIDNLSNQQKTRIDDTLIEFFYGCNIPFKLVESKLFLNFLNAIRPAYTPPSVEAMSNDVLHDLHAKLGKHQSIFFNSNGILVITRTEIKQTLHVIGFVQSEEKIIYLKTWDIQEGHNLSLMINEAITLTNMKFNMIIYAVITDEDIRLLNTNQYSKLWILQCNISLATSIEKELVDLEFAEKVHYLLGQFSSKELQKDLITRGGVAFVLEGNSCCYNCDLFSTCLKNLRAMTQMMGERQYKLKTEVLKILIDESFEEDLNHSLDLLKPIYCIAEKCKNSKIKIADITEDWLMLKSTENVYYNPVQSRIDAILSPIALVANLLHPVYRGQRFKNDHSCMKKVMEFLINELDEEGMNDFGKYKNSTEIFGSRALKDYTNEQTFWQAVASIHPKLSAFAIKILQLPAAAPKLKSYPNNLNDLTPKRFEKLTDLFYHLNM
ncbi:uncharacterized protein LOC143896758 [Temnothorax americanus]|uniref:uncharacterized protein LOC143896758 n=1 Tax=Temnothorax americanus TaxID=1964332 RepID=UPI0040680910